MNKTQRDSIQQIYEAVYQRRIEREIERENCVKNSLNQRWYDASVVTLQEVLADISRICNASEELDPIEMAILPIPHNKSVAYKTHDCE